MFLNLASKFILHKFTGESIRSNRASPFEPFTFVRTHLASPQPLLSLSARRHFLRSVCISPENQNLNHHLTFKSHATITPHSQIKLKLLVAMSVSRQFVPVAHMLMREVRLQPSRYIPCANPKSRHLRKKDKPSLAMSTRRYFPGAELSADVSSFTLATTLAESLNHSLSHLPRYSEARELKCHFTFPTQRSLAFLAPLNMPLGYLHRYFMPPAPLQRLADAAHEYLNCCLTCRLADIL
jgi:hypothetical protein